MSSALEVRLRELLAKATAGDWAVHSQFARVIPTAHAKRPIGGHEDAVMDKITYAQEICALQWPDRHREESEVRANAQLIAAMKNALPALLDALEQQESTLLLAMREQAQRDAEYHATEVAALKTALQDIAEPIAALQRATPVDCKLNGHMALQICSDPEHYRRIARDALAALDGEGL